jgi:TonB family protein
MVTDILLKLLFIQIIWSLCFAVLWYVNKLRNVKSTKHMYQMLLMYFFTMPLLALLVFTNTSPQLDTPFGIITMPVIEFDANFINPPQAFNTAFPSIGITAFIALFVSVQIYLFHHLLNQHEDAAATQQAQNLLKALNKTTRVRVLRSARVSNAFSFRFIYGYVILPQKLHLSQRDMNFLLTHELMHILHYDFALNILQKIIRFISILNPLSTVLDKKIDHFRELCRDEETIAALGCDATTYSQFLLQLNQTLSNKKYNPIGATPLLKSSLLKERIMWLNRNQTKTVPRLPMLFSILVFFVFAACTSLENKKESGTSDNLIGLTSNSDDLFDYYDVQKKPTIVKTVSPNYPKEAYDKNIEASVSLRFIVTKDGDVTDISILKGHPLFNNAAIDALKKFEFLAGEENGKKVNTRWLIPFRFQLNSNKNSSAQNNIEQSDIVSYFAAEKKPRIKKSLAPKYPKDAYEKNIEGLVVVSFVITKDEKISNIEIIKGHPLLNNAAITAIKGYEFSSGETHGEKVNTRMQMPIHFKLNK